jgi:hypothetical protein
MNLYCVISQNGICVFASNIEDILIQICPNQDLLNSIYIEQIYIIHLNKLSLPTLALLPKHIPQQPLTFMNCKTNQKQPPHPAECSTSAVLFTRPVELPIVEQDVSGKTIK